MQPSHIIQTSLNATNYNIQPNLVDATNVVDDNAEHLSSEVFINKLKDKVRFPSQVIIDDDVDINVNIDSDIDLVFPETCTVKGNFTILNAFGKIKLPKNLIVTGNLNIAMCSQLEELPQKIEVNGELSIFSNRSLKTFTQQLTVGKKAAIQICPKLKVIDGLVNIGGDLNISGSGVEMIGGNFTVNDSVVFMGLAELTSIEGIWKVSKDFDVSQCQKLQTIKGNFQSVNANNLTNTDNNLKVMINSCNQLIEISASIVAKNITISSCPVLNSITGGLNVIDELYLAYCTSLTDISATNTRKLHLRECNNLLELSSSIRIIRELSVIQCNGLMSIPNIIFSLSDPQMFSAYFHNVNSHNLLNNLANQNIEPSTNIATILQVLTDALEGRYNARFLIEQPNLANRWLVRTYNTSMLSLVELTNSWNSKLEDQQLPNLILNNNEQQLLRRFLDKTLDINTKFSYVSTKYLAQRIFQLFMVIKQQPNIKPVIFNIIEEGLTSCTDRVVQTLTTIELKYIVNNLIEKAKNEGKDVEQELRLLGKQFFNLAQLMNYVTNYLNGKTGEDEIEVMLAFETKLAEKLNLPISAPEMCFPNTYTIKFDDIKSACDYVLAQNTEEKITEFLASWEPLDVYNRPKNIIAYTDLTFLETEKKNCIISFEKTKQMVYLNDNCYDYQKLCQWYITVGNEDPVTRLKFSWKNVYRIDQPVTTEKF
jgi:hypothetical protein